MFSFFPSNHKREEEASFFIAWLLNPRETHKSTLFFEYFIDRLKSHNAKFCDELTLHQANNYLWHIEQNIKNEGTGTKFIDIIGVPLQPKLPLIVIENKITAGISGEQLDYYQKYASDLSEQNGTKPLLVLMDASDRDLLADNNYNSWVSINYEWIWQAIRAYLKAPCAPEINHILRSYFTQFNDYEDWVYWSDDLQLIQKLHKEFPDLIKSKEYTNFLEYVYNPGKVMTSVHSTQCDVARTFFRFHEIFQDLADFDETEAFSYSSDDKDLGFQYISEHGGSKYSHFYIEGLPLKPDGKWFVYISYHRERHEFKLEVRPDKTKFGDRVKKFFKSKKKEIYKSFDGKPSQAEVKSELHKSLRILYDAIQEFKAKPKYRKALNKYKN